MLTFVFSNFVDGHDARMIELRCCLRFGMKAFYVFLAGKLTSELVPGGPTTVDPTPFRFSRFTDGGATGPTTGL